MGQLKTLSIVLGLASVAAASTFNEFRHSYGKIRSQFYHDPANARESRDVGYQGKTYKDEKWISVFPAIPETLDNVPISCENDDRNYCNYPDLVPFESTNIHEISKFPIPSGRCPDGYARVPTYDCLNFAPALFETTCCVYSTPPPQPVQMCPIDPANVVINGLAELCDGRLLLITYLIQESRQLVWQLNSTNMALTKATPLRVEDVTGGCLNGDQYQILATEPDGDCGIQWLGRNLATNIIKVCTVKYMDKITAGTIIAITDPDSGFSGLTNDGGQLGGVVVKGATNTAPETNNIFAGFGLGSKWAYVSFLIVSEAGRTGCSAFARINHWRYNNDAIMPSWSRVKLEPMVMGGGQSSTAAPPASSSSAYGNEPTTAGSGSGGGGSSAASSSDTPLQTAINNCNIKGIYYNGARDNIVTITASGQVFNYNRNGKLSSDASNQLDLNAIVCNVVKPTTPNVTGDNTDVLVYVPIPYQYPPPGAGNAYGSGGSSSYGSAPQPYQSSSQATTQAPQTTKAQQVYGQQSYMSAPSSSSYGQSSGSGSLAYRANNNNNKRTSSYENGINSDNANQSEEEEEKQSPYLQARKPQPFRYQRHDQQQ